MTSIIHNESAKMQRPKLHAAEATRNGGSGDTQLSLREGWHVCAIAHRRDALHDGLTRPGVRASVVAALEFDQLRPVPEGRRTSVAEE